MPAIPQSEVLVKFFEEIGEKCSEILAKFFADFRPSISRENGRKKFHEKSSTFSTVHQIKFFSLLQLWGPRGPIYYSKALDRSQVGVTLDSLHHRKCTILSATATWSSAIL